MRIKATNGTTISDWINMRDYPTEDSKEDLIDYLINAGLITVNEETGEYDEEQLDKLVISQTDETFWDKEDNTTYVLETKLFDQLDLWWNTWDLFTSPENLEKAAIVCEIDGYGCLDETDPEDVYIYQDYSWEDIGIERLKEYYSWVDDADADINFFYYFDVEAWAKDYLENYHELKTEDGKTEIVEIVY